MALQFPQREFQTNGQPMGQSQGSQRATKLANKQPRNSTMPEGDPIQAAIMAGIPEGFMGSAPVKGQPAPLAPQDNGMAARDALGGYNRQIAGFDTSDYGGDVKARNTVKNTFGRIASRYAGVPASMELLFRDPDFLRYFPNARRVEGGAGDKIDFGGVLSDFESGSPVGIVDVGRAFDPANNLGDDWGWMPEMAGGQAMGGNPIPGNQLYSQIQSSILQPQQQQGQMDQNQLLQMLQMLLGA